MWNVSPVTEKLKNLLRERRDVYIKSQIDPSEIKEIWLYAQQAAVIELMNCIIDDEFLVDNIEEVGEEYESYTSGL